MGPTVTLFIDFHNLRNNFGARLLKLTIS